MADVFTIISSVLCPTIEASQRCQEYIYRNQAAIGDVQTLIYFLFFPTVFLILFVYFLSSFVIKDKSNEKKLRLLLAVAIYVFIIISGWYPIILPLSEIWFFVIIIVIGLYILFFSLFRGFGTSGKGASSTLPVHSFRSGNSETARKKENERYKHDVNDQLEIIGKMIDNAEQTLKDLKASRKAGDISAIARFGELLEKQRQSIMEAIGNLPPGCSPHEVENLKKRWSDL